VTNAKIIDRRHVRFLHEPCQHVSDRDFIHRMWDDSEDEWTTDGEEDGEKELDEDSETGSDEDSDDEEEKDMDT
jgi:hypothetical protein